MKWRQIWIKSTTLSIPQIKLRPTAPIFSKVQFIDQDRVPKEFSALCCCYLLFWRHTLCWLQTVIFPYWLHTMIPGPMVTVWRNTGSGSGCWGLLKDRRTEYLNTQWQRIQNTMKFVTEMPRAVKAIYLTYEEWNVSSIWSMRLSALRLAVLSWLS